MVKYRISSHIYYVETILELPRKEIVASQKQCQYLVYSSKNTTSS